MQSITYLAPLYAAIAIGIVFLVVWRLRLASSKADGDYEPVSRAEYERELHEFLEGKRGDHFGVSHDAESKSLLMAVGEGDRHALVVAFLLPKDADRIVKFKSRFAAEGRQLTEETALNAFQGLNVVTLTYEAPSDFETLAPLLNRMLTQLQGPSQDLLYVSSGERRLSTR